VSNRPARGGGNGGAGPWMAGRMRTFVLIWSGQLVSQLGTHLSGFAVSLWVYQRSGSVTLFGIAALAAELPGLLLSPVAGALIDRWDRRRTLLACNAAGAAAALGMLLVARWGQLALWEVLLWMLAASLIGAFQVPAFAAVTTVLVERRDLARAAGMGEMSAAVAQLAAPALGGVLLTALRLAGVLLIDSLSFFAALAALWAVRIPPPPPSDEGRRARGSLLAEAAFGAAFVRARPALLALLSFQAAANLLFGFIMVLGAPMALHFVSAAGLGLLLSVGGVGMLAGSLLMTAWGGPRRLAPLLLAGQALCGLSAVAGGLRPNAALFGAGLFCFFFCTPIVTAASQAIWQRKVPADVQGRVFAVRRLAAWIGVPVAALVAGPLADYVFEPLLRPAGALAPSVGRLLGVGPGRGIALLFVSAGALMVVVALAGSLGRLRTVEAAVPDAPRPDEPPAEAGVELPHPLAETT
jgi:MFS transporter, DHA3 family, macrolide efflux protein